MIHCARQAIDHYRVITHRGARTDGDGQVEAASRRNACVTERESHSRWRRQGKGEADGHRRAGGNFGAQGHGS